jgi:hypothetical protein
MHIKAVLYVIFVRVKPSLNPAPCNKHNAKNGYWSGRARLAELLNSKVYNFEHHNILAKKAIACDMKRVDK